MISFIIIGKDESWRLEKCLSAIRRQAEIELLQPYEIIYVDSQSTDDSVELAKQYTDKVFLLTGECNAAIGRNVGAKEAQGDVLFFLDGDMELLEGVLSSLFENGNTLPYPFMSGVENEYLHDNDWNFIEIKARRNFTEGHDWFENVTGGLFIIEKELWNKIGGMDNRYVVNEDYDFGFRACGKGYRLFRHGKFWVNHFTRYYSMRTNLTVYKYSAFLIRKYCINSYAFEDLLKENYSAFLLVISLAILLLFKSLWGLALYLLVLLYRTAKVVHRTPTGLNRMTTFYRRFSKDVLLLYYICTFFPKQPEVTYQRVK